MNTEVPIKMNTEVPLKMNTEVLLNIKIDTQRPYHSVSEMIPY